jgi:hypothetical protein
MERSLPTLEDIFDRELAMKAGFLLIKPDAVQLGVAEYIIDYAAQRVEKEKAGKLSGVYILNPLRTEQVPLLYPQMTSDTFPRVANYLGEENSVMAVFKGNGLVDMRMLMLKIRGRGMHNWSMEELNGSIGLEDSVRGMLPVPGTTNLYFDVINKLKAKKCDSTLKLTSDELIIFCRNLVHSPGDYEETLGILGLLNITQLKENIPSKLLTFYREIRKTNNQKAIGKDGF